MIEHDIELFKDNETPIEKIPRNETDGAPYTHS